MTSPWRGEGGLVQNGMQWDGGRGLSVLGPLLNFYLHRYSFKESVLGSTEKIKKRAERRNMLRSRGPRNVKMALYSIQGNEFNNRFC